MKRPMVSSNVNNTSDEDKCYFFTINWHMISFIICQILSMPPFSGESIYVTDIRLVTNLHK